MFGGRGLRRIEWGTSWSNEWNWTGESVWLQMEIAGTGYVGDRVGLDDVWETTVGFSTASSSMRVLPDIPRAATCKVLCLATPLPNLDHSKLPLQVGTVRDFILATLKTIKC